MAKAKKYARSRPRKHARRTAPETSSPPNGSNPTQAIIRIPVPSARPWELNQEEVELVKDQICKGASNLEFQMCLARARHHKLDPLKGQIWFVPRRDRASGEDKKMWIAQVGIAGLRHIAARDHRKDFGNEDEPEYGPNITVKWQWNGNGRENDLVVPEWARVKIWKRGFDRPTVATVCWREIYPNIDYSPLVRQMPRLMLGKCASAACHRKAYPETGGLYIPEEFAAERPHYTDAGRLITYETEPEQAAKENGVDVEALRARGLWCEEHKCINNGRHIQEFHSKDAQPQQEPKKEEQAAAPQKAASQAPEKKQNPEWIVYIDYAQDESSPIVRWSFTLESDVWLKELQFEAEAVFRDGWYHVEPRKVETVKQLARMRGYKIEEILPSRPKSSPAGSTMADRRGSTEGGAPRSKPGSRDAANSPNVVLMKGVVEQANPESGKRPRLSILFKPEGEKRKWWMSTFDQTLFPFLSTAKEKGCDCEVYVEKRVKDPGMKTEKVYLNVVRLKRIGAQEFDEDGKTPVIQQRTREAGSNRLPFGQS